MTAQKMIKTILALTIWGAALAACNTVEGAGEDVSHAGHAITDTARDNK